jgi:hypothetical protein
MSLLRTLALATFLVACGSSKPASTTTPATQPSPPEEAEPVTPEEPDSKGVSDAELEKVGEQLAKFMEDCAAAIDAANNDCDKAAAGVRTVWSRDKEVLKGMMVLVHATADQGQTILAKFGPRMEAAEKKLAALDDKCADNAAWKQLETDMRKSMGNE